MIENDEQAIKPEAAGALAGEGHVAMLRSLRLMYDDGVMDAEDHPGTVAALDAAIAALSAAPVAAQQPAVVGDGVRLDSVVRVSSVLEKLRRLAIVIRTYGVCAPLALDHIADELEQALTALTPAATPELVGDDGLRLPTLDGFRGLHPDTLALVRRFAYALACKLSAAERKYGYSDAWASPDWMDECRQKLVEHVAKGDPRDVAAYCAFLWHHDESTAATPVPVAGEVCECVRECRRGFDHPLYCPMPWQRPAIDEACHCATCTCRPGMTPAVRWDASAAMGEGAVRDTLIAMGWTPPCALAHPPQDGRKGEE